MKKRLFYGILVNTLAFIFASQLARLTPAWTLVVAETSLHLLGAGIILGLVNALIRPILLILTLPLNILTWGLFTFVINTFMIILTSWLMPGFYVPGSGAAFIVSLIVTFANWLFSKWEI